MSAGFSQVMEVTGGYRRLGVSSAPRGAAGYAKNAAISAVVGGTVSKLVGGKFVNGAITGAFSRMFNDLQHLDSRDPESVGMSGIPRKSLWRRLTGWHFEGRERLNGVHPTYSEVGRRDAGWTLLPESQSVFHDNGHGSPELKYIHRDGREAVFTMDFTGQYEPYLDPK
ncbi:hypothetical protein [Leucothrix pacifica]|uniref:Uncharacterized protein n=1 Tax=Leucothrix pacifica TaxID=1247513 RepID=A0A317CA39_9GAMM|nr:hypothetical protein [Leucothrix pacifica]PWQ93240.1 hypothetical protein DKW60_18020 [Leucothrix pacifica]